jgi:hypothetical protein
LCVDFGLVIEKKERMEKLSGFWFLRVRKDRTKNDGHSVLAFPHFLLWTSWHFAAAGRKNCIK